jgi:hypothetical protein
MVPGIIAENGVKYQYYNIIIRDYYMAFSISALVLARDSHIKRECIIKVILKAKRVLRVHNKGYIKNKTRRESA